MHVRRNQAVDRQRVYNSVGIHHEQILVERRVNADDILYLVVDLELQRIHGRVEVDLHV